MKIALVHQQAVKEIEDNIARGIAALEDTVRGPGPGPAPLSASLR